MSHLFPWSEYIVQQTQVLLDSFDEQGGMLEVTGEFLHDDIFVKLLPGYEKNTQIQIMRKLILSKKCSLTYCINAKDVVRDKQLSQKYLPFGKYILKQIALIKYCLWITPNIIITMIDRDFIPPHIKELEELIEQQGCKSSHFYLWDSYKTNGSAMNILCSYDTNTGKSTIIQSSNIPYFLYSPLPIASLGQDHPLNITSQCYNYMMQENDSHNICILDEYISFLDKNILQENCIKLIQERAEYYEKLSASWYAEEEEGEEIQTMLTKLLYMKK